MSDSKTNGQPISGDSAQANLIDRLAAAEAERDRLQAVLDAQTNESIGAWLEIVSTESRLLGELQNTLSWKVTKPLRLVRKVQLKVTQVGVVRVSQLAVADLKRRFKGRRR